MTATESIQQQKEAIPWEAWEVERELCNRSLWEYTKHAWKIVEPDPLVEGWHLQAVCEHLEAISRKQIRNLIICIPPRHTKSLETTVFWPSWEWGPFNRPQTRWLCISYAASLSERDSVKCRTLMQSKWYRERWGSKFVLQGDQNAKERYNNVRGGYRIASSIGGVGTGEGGDRLVIDDPINIKEAHSEVVRKGVNDWWDMVMPTRLNNPKSGAKVIIMQRCHSDDLVGHIKATSPETYEWLVLPAEFEPATRCSTSIGFVDPRVNEGDLLWPQRFGPKEITELKKMGSYAYAAQFQQRPSPVEGGILKRHWWKFYTERPAPSWFDYLLQSWDMSFKGLDTCSYVCGQVWGVKGADKYLMDETREHLDFVQTLNAVRNLTLRWPKATLKLVEEKANGAAVISTLKNEISGLVPWEPEGSKESRAFAVSPEVESGNVYLPSPLICPWINDWIEETALFPNGPHNDRVDTFTQAMQRIQKMQKKLDLPPIESLTQKSMWSQGWNR